MHRSKTLFVLLALAVPLTPVSADERTHDITIDDYFSQAWVFDLAISPDGKFVAYSEGRWKESEENRTPDLWVVETATAKVRRLTFERANDHYPQWSPDGRRLYFTGSRKRKGEKDPPYNGKTQVWTVSVDGGEPSAVTREDDGINQAFLEGNGQALYYTTDRKGVGGDWKELKQTYSGLEYGHGVTNFSVLWKLDLVTWRKEKLIDQDLVIREFAVSPDGRHIAMVTTPDETTVSFEGKSSLDVYDVQTKKVTRLPDKLWRADAPSPYGYLQYLTWSADGRSLAFSIAFNCYPWEIIVAEWAAEQPTLSRILRPKGISIHTTSSGNPLAWRGNTTLCFLGDERARVRLWSINDVHSGKQGEAKELTPGDVACAGLSFNPSGKQGVVLMNGTTRPEDLFLIEEGTEPRRLTNLNPQVDTWKIPQLSIVSWKGANGDPVEGVLELPPDYKPGKPLPLIVQLHGGPTAASIYHFEFWPFEGHVQLAARGYAAFRPNFRGSTGYGDAFLTALAGKTNDIEVKDVLTGIDQLIKDGIADEKRLGVMGWSYGGYLTNCLIGRKNRFKAASSGGTITDMTMAWGISDEAAIFKVFVQGLPWQKPDRYRKASPLYRVNEITTPTIFHAGGADERCPPEHARMLYRALREELHRTTELVVYPGESHTPSRYSSRKAKMDWDLQWFDHFILDKPLGKDAKQKP